MSYNFKNAFVCLWANAPVKLSDVSSVPIDELVVLGVTKAESGYTVEDDEVIVTSTRRKTAVSQKLTVNLDIITQYAPSVFLADMDNKQNCLVFVDSDAFPDIEPVSTSEEYKTLAEILEAAEYAMPEDVTCTVLTKKITTTVKEDVKYGSGKVIPFNLSGLLEGVRTKDELRKNDVPLIDA